jgi:hypothetical protein
MAKQRLTGATFTAAAKTVLHTSFSDVGLAGIQLIVNVTDQIIIYNFADTAKGGTLSTDTLTLEYDTTSMSDTDELMILVEDGVAAQAVTGAFYQATQPVSFTGSGDVATQTTLALIKAKTDNIPALGQALAAASVPVVLTATQLSTLTPPAAITNFALETGGNLATLVAATKLEDSGHTTGDRGMAILGVRNEGHDDFSGTDKDYIPIALDAAGQVFCHVVNSAHAQLDFNQADYNTDVGTDNISMFGIALPSTAGATPALGGAGAVAAGVQRVTLASDDPAVTSLAAINAKMVTGTDIGDVTINNGTGAAAVNIQDGGNTITVDGTVAVTNAGLTALNGAIAGTEVQVDVLTMPTVAVTGAFYQATQPVSGTVALDGATLAALENITVSGSVTVDATALDIRALTTADAVTVSGGVLQTADVKVTLDSESLAVTGTFFQATQPVSIAAAVTVTATDLDIRNLVAATDIVDLGGNALTSLQLIDNAVSGAGFNITQLGGAAVPLGAGLEATALRVTVATNSTGVLSIYDT